VRLTVIAPHLNRPVEDPDNYLPLARSIAAGQGMLYRGRPTAYRPPLYPLVLAPLVKAFPDGRPLVLAVTTLHLGLGAFTVLLTAAAARRVGLSTRRQLVAACVVACDPVLIVQAPAVMTETMAAALLAGVLWGVAAPRRRAQLLTGVLAGLLCLCRPSFLPAVALVWLSGLTLSDDDVRRRFSRAAFLALGVFVVMAPWAIRNVRVWGEPVWTTTHGGYTLYLANNPVYYRDVLNGPPGAIWSGPAQLAWFRQVNLTAGSLPEPAGDRHFAREAIRFIAAHPTEFARASLARLGRFWGIAPAGSVYSMPLRVATALWTIPLWIALFCGLAQRATWRWPVVASVGFVLGLTLVHAVFWTDMRMRAPIVPALAILAARCRLRSVAPRPQNGVHG
jgi:hypothetical protein